MDGEAMARARALNDQLRRDWIWTAFHEGGPETGVRCTAGIQALSPRLVATILLSVSAFDEFGSGHPAARLHDFGLVEVEGHRILWLIDCYHPDGNGVPGDPSDARCTRIMTVMLAEEWV